MLYRPVKMGIATLEETKAMNNQELIEINQIAISLEEEQAHSIAAYVSKIFAPDEKANRGKNQVRG